MPSTTEVHEPTRLHRLAASYRSNAPRIVYWVALLVGLLTIIEALLPSERHRVHAVVRLLPVPASAAASAVTAVAGVLLLRVASGLRRRKRREWRLAVGLSVVLIVAHVLKGHNVFDAVISFVLLVVLLGARKDFTARNDPASRWIAVRLAVQLLIVTYLYGLAMLYLYPHQVDDSANFWQRIQEITVGLVGIDGPLHFRSERFSDIVHGTFLGFALLIVVLVALVAFRPSQSVPTIDAEDELKLRALLCKQGGRDSLGYFALRRDKSVVWSSSAKAAITYRVVSGVALVSGDPIGDPEAWPGAISAYQDLITQYAWTPAVMGCSEQGAMVFKRELDLSAIELGDEAIVEVNDFSLDGRAMRGVRQAVTRVSRAGYEVKVRRVRDIDPAEFTELLRVANAWRGAAVERGFSMALSRLGDPADQDCVVATAYLDGVLRGLLHFVPWGSDGLSLDLMRRDRDAENGLNELLIVSLIQGCEGLGVTRVSLNFAVFRDAIERGERIGAGPVLRAWRGVLIFASRWWQIESLYRFNVKFRPIWEPRFLSFPTTSALPRIALAAMEAEAFLVRPRVMQRVFGRV